MAEGRTEVWYTSDLVSVYDDTGAAVPALFKFSEPNNLVAQASLGWISTPPATVPDNLRRPRRFTPRHAIGIDPSGKRHRVICATTACDLWTGAASTWTFIDNFGATITATVTGRAGEKATD